MQMVFNLRRIENRQYLRSLERLYKPHQENVLFLIYHLHKSPFSKHCYIIEVIGRHSLYKQIHFVLFYYSCVLLIAHPH